MNVLLRYTDNRYHQLNSLDHIVWDVYINEMQRVSGEREDASLWEEGQRLNQVLYSRHHKEHGKLGLATLWRRRIGALSDGEGR